jgi:hypothetical protein
MHVATHDSLTLTLPEMDRTPTSSRPLTPVSPVGSIVSNPAIHFDDEFNDSLVALRNFSNRSMTPLQLSCCCGRQDCESLQSCREVNQKLEKELVLSAGEPQFSRPAKRSFPTC